MEPSQRPIGTSTPTPTMTTTPSKNSIKSLDPAALYIPKDRKRTSSSTSEATSSLRLASPILTAAEQSAANPQDDCEEGDTVETGRAKRSTEHPGEHSVQKRIKVAGDHTIDLEEMNQHLSSFETALFAKLDRLIEVAETSMAANGSPAVTTTEGQAQEAVQDEDCLTEGGKLIVMAKFGNNAKMAQMYKLIKSKSLRQDFLKYVLGPSSKEYIDGGSPQS